MKLGKPVRHKELKYLIVTPVEKRVLHDELQPRTKNIVFYLCDVSNGSETHQEYYTEKYLKNDFQTL